MGDADVPILGGKNLLGLMKNETSIDQGPMLPPSTHVADLLFVGGVDGWDNLAVLGVAELSVDEELVREGHVHVVDVQLDSVVLKHRLFVAAAELAGQELGAKGGGWDFSVLRF